MMDCGCNVNLQIYNHVTALGRACFMGRDDSVAVLLKNPKIDINFRANGLKTALFLACWKVQRGKNTKESPNSARLLLQAGADPDIPDDIGRTPLIVAC